MSAREHSTATVFRIAPPLTSSIAELDLGLEILDRAIGEVSRSA